MMEKGTMYVTMEYVDGEATLLAAFTSLDDAEPHREEVIREQARECIDCGGAPEGMDLSGDIDDIANELAIRVEVQAVEVRR